MQRGPARDLAQHRSHEGLEGDLGADRVTGQTEDRRALHGAHPELAAGRHGHGVEADRAQRRQDVLDRVALPHRQAAGGDEDVGAHELVLDGLPQGAQLVGHGGHAEGASAGVGHGAGQGVPVGVEDLSGFARPAGLDQFVADGDNDDTGGRVDIDAVPSDPGQEGDLPGGDARPLRQHGGARGHILPAAAHIRPALHARAHLDPGGAAVRGGPGHDGVRALGHGGPGVDNDGGAPDQADGAHVPGPHVVDDIEAHGAAGEDAREVVHGHGVAVQAGHVDDGQVQLGDDVLGQDAADGVEQDDVEGRGGLGDVEAGGQVLGDGSHGCPPDLDRHAPSRSVAPRLPGAPGRDAATRPGRSARPGALRRPYEPERIRP